MTSVATRPGSTRNGNLVYWLGAIGLFLAIMLVVYPALRLPTFETVTVENPHAWVANVEVAGTAGDGGLGIGSVGPGETVSFREVVDQGPRWVFRFSYAGTTVELQADRATLRRDGWKVRVPDEFADKLRAARVKETPLGAS